MLDAVLVAEGRVQTALAFLNQGPEEARAIAIYALGRLKLDQAQVLDVLDALDRDFVPSPSDLFQAQRIDVAVKLAKVVEGQVDGRLRSILNRSLLAAEPRP